MTSTLGIDPRDYYQLEPEVAGHFGDDHVMNVAYHPPRVRNLHCEFDGWLGDDLITAFPCFIVTDRLRLHLEVAKATGCSFEGATISTSELFEELYPDRRLPKFWWMKVHGRAGRDDVGIWLPRGELVVASLLPGTVVEGNALVVSGRVLTGAVDRFQFSNCPMVPFRRTMS